LSCGEENKGREGKKRGKKISWTRGGGVRRGTKGDNSVDSPKIQMRSLKRVLLHDFMSNPHQAKGRGSGRKRFGFFCRESYGSPWRPSSSARHKSDFHSEGFGEKTWGKTRGHLQISGAGKRGCKLIIQRRKFWGGVMRGFWNTTY